MTGTGKGIRVTVEDLETGETESAEIMDDYVIVTHGNRYVSGTVEYPAAGTSVVTIKRDKAAA